MILVKNLQWLSGEERTKNKIKDITKVVNSLQNTDTLFKEITKKVTNQKGGFYNFLRPSMTAGLKLLKNVLTP